MFELAIFKPKFVGECKDEDKYLMSWAGYDYITIGTNPNLFSSAFAFACWYCCYPTFRLEDHIYEDQSKEQKVKGYELHCKDG